MKLSGDVSIGPCTKTSSSLESIVYSDRMCIYIYSRLSLRHPYNAHFDSCLFYLRQETQRRYQALASKDSLSCSCAAIHQIERLVQILRGTSFLLGVPCADGPTTIWAPIAEELLGLP